jgi:hypothetical protein
MEKRLKLLLPNAFMIKMSYLYCFPLSGMFYNNLIAFGIQRISIFRSSMYIVNNAALKIVLFI